MRKGIALFFLILSGLFIRAVASDTNHSKRIQVIPVPFIYYSPESRFGIGGGVSFTFQLHRDTLTNYSQLFFVAAVTQNRQIVTYLPFDFYTRRNAWFLDGEIGFYKYSYYYWGIGADRNPGELYAVRYPRLIANIYKKITSRFFAGLDYIFEKDVILKTEPGGELDSADVTGARGCRVSGIGLDALYDSRDSIFFPSKGWYIKASSYFNFKGIGASTQFSKIITSVSLYKQISKPVILAFNEFNIFSFGDVPFNQLGLLGGGRQMRGYYMGFYRDNFLSLFQAEARIHLHNRWGADIFAAAALLGHPGQYPVFKSPIFAEGLGLRYNANIKHHINIRGDVGYGKTLEYYLAVEEAF